MVWDHLRSCYGFTMRLFIGGQAVTVPARWYFCAPGAQPFPGPHGCAASPWLGNDEVNLDWGEVTPWPKDPNSAVQKVLDNGLNPGYAGQCFTGNPQWFIDGQLPAGIDSGQPLPFDRCCFPPQASATGGIVLGGSAIPKKRCQLCPVFPSGEACNFQVTLAGCTGQFAPFNGTWTLTELNSCEWFAPVPNLTLKLRIRSASPLVMELLASDTLATFEALWDQKAGWDAFFGGILSLVALTGTGSVPTSVLIQ